MWERLKLDDLKIGKLLGRGAFGEVYESSIKGHDGKYAVKKLIKEKYKKNPKGYKYLENEIKILKDTSHDNIVKLYSSDIETPLHRYLVTEYCNGGDLNTCLEYYKKTKNRPFTEEEVQHIMRQIVSAIKYLHVDKKIIHRDLKLENILLHYDNDTDRKEKNILKAKIKIIDFGFARFIKEGIAESILGSPLFMDPRILLKLNKLDNSKDFKYEEKADIYSLGIICYILLTGNQLFDVNRMDELVKETQEGIYKISVHLSKETISFLNYMLKYDLKKRLDIKRLSEHQFITKEMKNFTRIDKKEVGNNLSGSQIIFDLNYSTNPYFHDDAADMEVDEIKKKYADDLNKAGTKIKEIIKDPKPEDFTKIKTPEGNQDEEKLNKEIEKLIFYLIDIINNNEISFEPKIVPFIPGMDPNVLLITE